MKMIVEVSENAAVVTHYIECSGVEAGEGVILTFSNADLLRPCNADFLMRRRLSGPINGKYQAFITGAIETKDEFQTDTKKEGGSLWSALMMLFFTAIFGGIVTVYLMEKYVI